MSCTVSSCAVNAGILPPDSFALPSDIFQLSRVPYMSMPKRSSKGDLSTDTWYCMLLSKPWLPWSASLNLSMPRSKGNTSRRLSCTIASALRLSMFMTPVFPKSSISASLPKRPSLYSFMSFPLTLSTPSSVGMTTFMLLSSWVVADISQLTLPSKVLSAGIRESTMGRSPITLSTCMLSKSRFTPAEMSRLLLVE